MTHDMNDISFYIYSAIKITYNGFNSTYMLKISTDLCYIASYFVYSLNYKKVMPLFN